MARQFKYLNPEVQKHLDEVRIMSDNIRPGEGHNWIHNARGLQRHISNQRARKEEEKQEEDLFRRIHAQGAIPIRCEMTIGITRLYPNGMSIRENIGAGPTIISLPHSHSQFRLCTLI